MQAKLANFHHLAQTRGLHFNDSLASSKAFRNPRIYAKLVDFVDVVETGSNWDKDVWDPHGLPPDSSAARIGESSPGRGARVPREADLGLHGWRWGSATAARPDRGSAGRAERRLEILDRIRFVLTLEGVIGTEARCRVVKQVERDGQTVPVGCGRRKRRQSEGAESQSEEVGERGSLESQVTVLVVSMSMSCTGALLDPDWRDTSRAQG